MPAAVPKSAWENQRSISEELNLSEGHNCPTTDLSRNTRIRNINSEYLTGFHKNINCSAYSDAVDSDRGMNHAPLLSHM